MEKFNKYILILIVVVVLAMSIGYSALNKELNISGEVNYRPQSDVRITKFTTSSKPSTMTIEYSDFSKHQVKLGYTSTAACNFTYTIEITNYSNVNMGILKIEGMDGNVEIQEGILGGKLVGAGEAKSFTITFKSTKAETKTYLLTFDFKQVYTVTYSGFDNTENFKKEILEGQDYLQNFGNSAPNDIEITMGEEPLKNYVYTDGILIIKNITGDLVITGIFAPSFVDSCSIHPNKPELNGDMIPVVYDEEKEMWVKQNLEKSYDYCNQIWANAVTIVSKKRDEIKKASVGTPIDMSDINTMWVWIPRYSYTIKGTYGRDGVSAALPGAIDIKFLSKSSSVEKGRAKYTRTEPPEGAERLHFC